MITDASVDQNVLRNCGILTSTENLLALAIKDMICGCKLNSCNKLN